MGQIKREKPFHSSPSNETQKKAVWMNKQNTNLVPEETTLSSLTISSMFKCLGSLASAALQKKTFKKKVTKRCCIYLLSRLPVNAEKLL